MSNFEERVKSQGPFVLETDPVRIAAARQRLIDYGLLPATKSVEPAIAKAGIPGPLEVERAISRLAILPNPAHPDLSEEDASKYVESPWATIPAPTVDPNVYDKAVQLIVNLADLTGTDPFLKRKRVIKHIESMGQALTKFRSLPIVADDGARMIILDGHHRLMSSWLLGDETAPVWKVEI
jgi:hypothetical protein